MGVGSRVLRNLGKGHREKVVYGAPGTLLGGPRGPRRSKIEVFGVQGVRGVFEGLFQACPAREDRHWVWPQTKGP